MSLWKHTMGAVVTHNSHTVEESCVSTHVHRGLQAAALLVGQLDGGDADVRVICSRGKDRKRFMMRRKVISADSGVLLQPAQTSLQLTVLITQT